MFIANDLVYLELQKTGGSHICRLLEQYVGGRPEGKHNRLTAEFSKRYVVGSIRNPWDWYVSLWAYGIGGQGAVRSRTGEGVDFDYYHRMLPKAMGKNWLSPGEFLISFYHDAVKPVRKWQRTYKESSDPELFRAWLRLLLHPRHRFDIGEGYGFSPLSRSAGLLTYRYFRLYTLGDRVFRDPRLHAFSRVGEFDREFNITQGMIRTESLEEDLIRVLSEAGYSFSEKQLRAIRNQNDEKTNVSERKSADFYYDEETVALVAERDRYLIEKYGYVAPI